MQVFMFKFFFAFLTFLQLSCFPSTEGHQTLPSPFKAKVIGVKDGDTVEVLYENQPYVIRLANIDCPEKGQPFGQKAKQYCSDLCFGKMVSVEHKNKFDRNKRLIATLICNGQNINETLVKEGFAWHYVAYSTQPHIETLQQQAKAKKVGLWAEAEAVAPWEWRKAKKNKAKK